MTRPLRIAMVTHSLNPRGGVVHALSVAEALAKLGHHLTLVAPALPGERLFRDTTVEARFFPAKPIDSGLSALVRKRVEEYADFTRSHSNDTSRLRWISCVGSYIIDPTWRWWFRINRMYRCCPTTARSGRGP